MYLKVLECLHYTLVIILLLGVEEGQINLAVPFSLMQLLEELSPLPSSSY